MTADGFDPAAPSVPRDELPPPADEPDVDTDAKAATDEPPSPAATDEPTGAAPTGEPASSSASDEPPSSWATRPAGAPPAGAPPADAETGPVAVLAEALTVAAGSSRLLRRASIYIGLLMLALAGPGVVAGLALIGSLDFFDPTASMTEERVGEAARAAILIAIALVGAIIASIEGAAIGITLLAGRVLDRPISLGAALERSRRVFWRIIRAGFIVGVVEITMSHLWQVVTGKAQLGDLSQAGLEPLPGAIATLPFVYATVAIVLADDGARAALRRSVSIARSNRWLTVALGLFGLLAGVVQTFALGSGLDLITRLTEALHLDITAGGLSFLLAGALALAIVMAAGSLLFTVTAIVNAPQLVAWSRLGLPLDGLPAAPLAAVATVAVSAEPAAGATAPLPAPFAVPSGAGPELAFSTGPLVATAQEPEPAPAFMQEPSLLAEPAPGPSFEALPAPQPEPLPAPPMSGWGQPGAPAPSAWAIAAQADAERPFRWVTLPMRFTVLGMWLIAIVSLISERAI